VWAGTGVDGIDRDDDEDTFAGVGVGVGVGAGAGVAALNDRDGGGGLLKVCAGTGVRDGALKKYRCGSRGARVGAASMEVSAVVSCD
jgi:hypothetical protein